MRIYPCFHTTIFILSLIYSSFSLSAQTEEYYKKITDKLIFKDLNIPFERSPSVLVGIIDADSCYVLSYGSISKDSIVRPAASDLFEIGSISNVFTARLIHILDEKNIIKKDVSINNYLPARLKNPTANHITIQHLLTHSSGLPRVPLGIGITQIEDNQPYSGYSKSALASYFKQFNFTNAETGKYNFSHLGYAIIEMIVEAKTGRSFEDVLLAEVLKKDFPNTKINLTKTDYTRLVQGFDKAHNPTAIWQHPTFAAATGIKSNMLDLLTLVRKNIEHSDFEKSQIPQLSTEIRKNVFAAEAWHVIQKKRKHNIVLHTGATSGHRAYIAFVKELKIGVVVLSNSEYALRGLGYLILTKMQKNAKKR